MVGQLTCNQWVKGSSPLGSSYLLRKKMTSGRERKLPTFLVD